MHSLGKKEPSQGNSRFFSLVMFFFSFFCYSILVPSDMIGAIIGKEGHTIRAITEHTGARYAFKFLHIPMDYWETALELVLIPKLGSQAKVPSAILGMIVVFLIKQSRCFKFFPR